MGTLISYFPRINQQETLEASDKWQFDQMFKLQLWHVKDSQLKSQCNCSLLLE